MGYLSELLTVTVASESNGNNKVHLAVDGLYHKHEFDLSGCDVTGFGSLILAVFALGCLCLKKK
jgi:hypothetical protein